ncbi:2-amino-4-hydroxy-6-hydroxymethyldihydropteridine diphosphokinase [Sphingobium aquiterrae]|uniref:2-amino-4-hydroxy-6- hydroxymethyldihydropteridine diphosphokinase n=1 Tax=Sphingobium aquiterrae TaxID=2038656 RepID=UPI0030158F09
MGYASYAIAIGSNRPLSARLSPAVIVRRAMAALNAAPLRLRALSPVMSSPPMGPSARIFANAAVVVETILPPPALLRHLKALERHFGRSAGRRWGARTLDLDIILWSGGRWRSRSLTIPHPAWRKRDFVLTPLAAIAPDWRDPWGGLSVRHLHARLARARPCTGTHAKHPCRPSKGPYKGLTALPSFPSGSRIRHRAGPLAQSVEQLTFNQ